MKCPYTLTKGQSVRAFLFTAKGATAKSGLKLLSIINKVK